MLKFWAKKIALIIFVLLTSFLSFLFLSQGIQAQSGGLSTSLYSSETNPEDFYLENQITPGVYDTPYYFTDESSGPLGTQYRIRLKSVSGYQEYVFTDDVQGVRLYENGNVDARVDTSEFYAQYWRTPPGAWNDIANTAWTLKAFQESNTVIVFRLIDTQGTVAGVMAQKWELGWNPINLQYVRKISVKLLDSNFDKTEITNAPDLNSANNYFNNYTSTDSTWNSQFHRIHWDLTGISEITSNQTDIRDLEGNKPTNKIYGNLEIDWVDFGDDIQLNEVSANKKTELFFIPSGQDGDLEIDPTMGVSVSSSQIVVTANRYIAHCDYDGGNHIEELYADWYGGGSTDVLFAANQYFGMNRLIQASPWANINDNGVSGQLRGTDWDIYLLEASETRVVIYAWFDYSYSAGISSVWLEEYTIFYPDYIIFHNVYHEGTGASSWGWRYPLDQNYIDNGDPQYRRNGDSNWNDAPDDNTTVDVRISGVAPQYFLMQDDSSSPGRYSASIFDLSKDPSILTISAAYWARAYIAPDYGHFEISNPTDGETHSHLFTIDDESLLTEIPGKSSDYFNADDLSDGLTTGSGWFDSDENTSSSTDFFNESEITYNLEALNNQVVFDLDGGTYARYKPLFKIRAYRTKDEPTTVTLEGSTLTDGTDYNTDSANFSEAWLFDSDGSGYQKLADGGDTGDADEYLHDPSADFDFGDSTYTFNANDDYFYLGSHDQFTGVNSDLATTGSGDASIQWQYCGANSDIRSACDTWTNLSVTDSDTNAQHLRASGNFYFTDPSGWAKAMVNSGSPLYWIRGSVSSGSYTTTPIENTIRTDILVFQYLSNISSDDQTFSISANTAPSAPTIDNYNDGSWITDNTPTLQFDLSDPDSGDIVKYQIQIDDNSDFPSPVVDETETTGSASPRNNVEYTPATLDDGSYYWRVKAIDDDSEESVWVTANSGGIAFRLDTTDPTAFDLDSPGHNNYTGGERPTFKWKAASNTDAGSGLSKYRLEIDNGDSGDFYIDNIPVSRTSDYETNQYTIKYENFDDADSTNNYLSVYTKSSSEWGESENDGKLKEGKRIWRVVAVDNVNKAREESRILFVDKNNPSVEITEISGHSFSENLATNDTTPMIKGKISDSLAGDKADNEIASGPKEAEIKIEKKSALGVYSLHTQGTISLAETYWASDDAEISDNSQNISNKYANFGYTLTSLSLGSYRITITGKDEVGNSSSQSFNLKIGILEEIEEELVEEEEIEEEEVVEEKIEEEIVKEIEPKESVVEKAIASLAETLRNIYWQQVGAFKSLLSSITDIGQKGVEYVAQLWQRYGQFRQGLDKEILVGFEDYHDNLNRIYNQLAEETPQIIANRLILSRETSEKVVILISEGISKAIIERQEFLADASVPLKENAQEKAEDLKVKVASTLSVWFDKEPTQISEVKVVEAGKDYAVIIWKTNHYATSKVNYGFSYDYGQDVQSSKKVKEHRLMITGLKPNTRYYYEVMSQNKNYVFDARHEFMTLGE